MKEQPSYLSLDICFWPVITLAYSIITYKKFIYVVSDGSQVLRYVEGLFFPVIQNLLRRFQPLG
jgi:hypothetical protein